MYNSHEHDAKVLVSLALEETLLEIGKTLFNEITERLQKEYNCKLSDCFEYPEYLKIILKDYFGDEYDEIFDLIKEKLVEFEYRKPIQEFLTAMRK